MRTVTADFKTAMKAPVKRVTGKLVITAGTDEITANDDLINFTVSGEAIAIGKSVLRKLTATYIGDRTLVGSTIHPVYGVVLPDTSIEYVDMGEFLVTQCVVDKEKETVTLTAYDRMIYTIADYDGASFTFPTTVQGLNDEMMTLLGLNASPATIPFDDLEIDVDLYENISGTQYRTVVEEIAVLGGNIALINEDDDLVYRSIKTPTNTVETVDYDLLKKLKIDERYGKINRLTLSRQPQEDNVILQDEVEIKASTSENLLDMTRLEQGASSTQPAWTVDVSSNQINVIADDADPNVAYRLKLDPDVMVHDQVYTISVGDITSDDVLFDTPIMALEWLNVSDDDLNSSNISANSSYTFTYDSTLYYDWTLAFFVSDADAIPAGNTVLFEELMLADDTYDTPFVQYKEYGMTEFKIVNNQIIDQQREEVALSIFDYYDGIQYFPFSIETIGLGWFEIGDKILIEDNNSDTFSVIVMGSSITIDGSLKERLYFKAPTKVESNFAIAGGLNNRIKNTELIVDKQTQTITSVVEDLETLDGETNESFTTIQQDITSIINSVQSSGGTNLIKNSAFFAYDNDNVPESWTAYNVVGEGIFYASPEAVSQGSISGHVVELDDISYKQDVTVVQGNGAGDPEEQVYYSFRALIKKETLGDAKIKLTDGITIWELEILSGTSKNWEEVSFEAILPETTNIEVSIEGDDEAEFKVTDMMLSVGEIKKLWEQGNGEIMNTQVNISSKGITVKSSVFIGDYTSITPTEFAGYAIINSVLTKVFSLNKEVTEVEKLDARSEISMQPIKIVPLDNLNETGWAFVGLGE
jgi:hypothetical protein